MANILSDEHYNLIRNPSVNEKQTDTLDYETDFLPFGIRNDIMRHRDPVQRLKAARSYNQRTWMVPESDPDFGGYLIYELTPEQIAEQRKKTPGYNKDYALVDPHGFDWGDWKDIAPEAAMTAGATAAYEAADRLLKVGGVPGSLVKNLIAAGGSKGAEYGHHIATEALTDSEGPSFTEDINLGRDAVDIGIETGVGMAIDGGLAATRWIRKRTNRPFTRFIQGREGRRVMREQEQLRNQLVDYEVDADELERINQLIASQGRAFPGSTVGGVDSNVTPMATPPGPTQPDRTWVNPSNVGGGRSLTEPLGLKGTWEQAPDSNWAELTSLPGNMPPKDVMSMVVQSKPPTTPIPAAGDYVEVPAFNKRIVEIAGENWRYGNRSSVIANLIDLNTAAGNAGDYIHAGNVDDVLNSFKNYARDIEETEINQVIDGLDELVDKGGVKFSSYGVLNETSNRLKNAVRQDPTDPKNKLLKDDLDEGTIKEIFKEILNDYPQNPDIDPKSLEAIQKVVLNPIRDYGNSRLNHKPMLDVLQSIKDSVDPQTASTMSMMTQTPSVGARITAPSNLTNKDIEDLKPFGGWKPQGYNYRTMSDKAREAYDAINQTLRARGSDPRNPENVSIATVEEIVKNLKIIQNNTFDLVKDTVVKDLKGNRDNIGFGFGMESNINDIINGIENANDINDFNVWLDDFQDLSNERNFNKDAKKYMEASFTPFLRVDARPDFNKVNYSEHLNNVINIHNQRLQDVIDRLELEIPTQSIQSSTPGTAPSGTMSMLTEDDIARMSQDQELSDILSAPNPNLPAITANMPTMGQERQIAAGQRAAEAAAGGSGGGAIVPPPPPPPQFPAGPPLPTPDDIVKKDKQAFMLEYGATKEFTDSIWEKGFIDENDMIMLKRNMARDQGIRQRAVTLGTMGDRESTFMGGAVERAAVAFPTGRQVIMDAYQTTNDQFAQNVMRLSNTAQQGDAAAMRAAGAKALRENPDLDVGDFEQGTFLELTEKPYDPNLYSEQNLAQKFQMAQGAHAIGGGAMDPGFRNITGPVPTNKIRYPATNPYAQGVADLEYLQTLEKSGDEANGLLLQRAMGKRETRLKLLDDYHYGQARDAYYDNEHSTIMMTNLQKTQQELSEAKKGKLDTQSGKAIYNPALRRISNMLYNKIEMNDGIFTEYGKKQNEDLFNSLRHVVSQDGGRGITRAATPGQVQTLVPSADIKLIEDRMSAIQNSVVANNTAIRSDGGVDAGWEVSPDELRTQIDDLQKAMDLVESKLPRQGAPNSTTGDKYKAVFEKIRSEMDDLRSSIRKAQGNKPSIYQMQDAFSDLNAEIYAATSNSPRHQNHPLKGKDQAIQQLEKVRQALRDDIMASVEANAKEGYDAKGLMENAMNFHSNRYKHEQVIIDEIMDAATPQAAFDWVVKGSDKSATRLRDVMRNMPEEEAQTFRSAWFDRLGMENPQLGWKEGNFDMGRFHTNLKAIPRNNRDILFGNDTNFRKQIERWEKFVDDNLTTGFKYENPTSMGQFYGAIITLSTGSVAGGAAYYYSDNPLVGAAFAVAGGGLAAGGVHALPKMIGKRLFANPRFLETQMDLAEEVSQTKIHRLGKFVKDKMTYTGNPLKRSIPVALEGYLTADNRAIEDYENQRAAVDAMPASINKLAAIAEQEGLGEEFTQYAKYLSNMFSGEAQAAPAPVDETYGGAVPSAWGITEPFFSEVGRGLLDDAKYIGSSVAQMLGGGTMDRDEIDRMINSGELTDEQISRLLQATEAPLP